MVKRKLEPSFGSDEKAREKNKKLQILLIRLLSKQEISLPDLELGQEIPYKISGEDTEFGKSNNLLFYLIHLHKPLIILERQDIDFTKIIDSNKNTILHYTVFLYKMDLVKVILEQSKTNNTISSLVNQRNSDGTNPLGMAFLKINKDAAAAIKMATLFASVEEYQINSYLNNKKYMDYSSAESPGGTTLLHNILLSAAECAYGEKDIIRPVFEALSKRLDYDGMDELYFNPNYPTMYPINLLNGSDGHMISTTRLFEKLKPSFESRRISQLCEKYLTSILQSYAAQQLEDSSGDSDEEDSPASEYKKMLLSFNDYIKGILEGQFPDTDIKPNFLRTFDKFEGDYVNLSEELAEHVWSDEEKKLDKEAWKEFWDSLNQRHPGILTEHLERFGAVMKEIAIPLFHGVPFMQSQYTNYQRREIFEKIFTINEKLWGKFSGTMNEEDYSLTPEEKIIMGIHSRTATASVGLQSLYEVATASKSDLTRLEKVDNILYNHFAGRDYKPKFKEAMQKYIFNFATSPIETFWEDIFFVTKISPTPPNLTVVEGLDNSVVKYRFPIIATSKAPDHAVRFAIGRNVEVNRGETPMQPEYNEDGYPTHRLAGLVYVTLHNLSDLITQEKHHIGVDVKREIRAGNIGNGTNMFKHQQEYDFLGRIYSDNIIAIVPVIYPNVSKEGGSFDIDYHQAIWGLNYDTRIDGVVRPEKIRKDVKQQPNPEIMNSEKHLAGFGSMFVPTIVSMINGLLTSVADKKGKFLCSIKEDGSIIPYNVTFDKDGKEFSKAQLNLEKDNSEGNAQGRFWYKLVEELLLLESSDNNENETSDDGMTGLTEKTNELNITSPE